MEQDGGTNGDLIYDEGLVGSEDQVSAASATADNEASWSVLGAKPDGDTEPTAGQRFPPGKRREPDLAQCR